MNRSLLGVLRCPSGCESALEITSESEADGQIQSGTLGCAQCGGEYPIQDGIPCMLPEGLRCEKPEAQSEADASKIREMKARDEQAGDYDRMWYLNLFGLLEIPATLAHLSLKPNHALLEAGCGTGRMTRRFAARCRELVSVDYSRESLKRCRTKLELAGIHNVQLVQADLCRLPLKSESFDRVVSCQVLEHIPTPETRALAVEEMARVTRSDGNLAISAYQYSLIARLFGQKEGEHQGGIYFYRFTRGELRDLLSKALTVERITGALVYHYIAKCRKGPVIGNQESVDQSEPRQPDQSSRSSGKRAQLLMHRLITDH